MDVTDLRDQLDLRDQRDHRDQLDPMDVMDSGEQLDSMDVMDSPVQRGKREIEEYSYEGLLDYKVQVVPSYFSGRVCSHSFSHIYYILTCVTLTCMSTVHNYRCNNIHDIHINLHIQYTLLLHTIHSSAMYDTHIAIHKSQLHN